MFVGLFEFEPPFWGSGLYFEGQPSEGQCACLDSILKDVKRIAGIHQAVEDVDWSNFFNVRAIDYKGDEVKVAKWFRWENIGAALPAEVGVVPLEEICSLGCRDYVLNFDNYLKPQEEWPELTCPRVMVTDSDWPQVCHGLISSGVCTFIPEEEIFTTKTGLVLNGMFGVSKDETTPTGVPIYRLIMNLIPLNALCKPLAL